MTSLRHACIAACLVLGVWAGSVDARGAAVPGIRAAGVARVSVAPGAGALPAAAGLRGFHYTNANARLDRNRTRLSTTAADVVASGFAQTPLRGRVYVEAAIHHGGQHAAGVSLWGEAPGRLRDDAHPGRSYGSGGASAQAVSAWTVMAYANYGLPGDTKVEMGALPGTPDQRIVIQVAVDADTRAVWMKLLGTGRWAGGGDPATGVRPTFVLGGTGPILVGGNVSNPASHVELLAPAHYTGAVPAGFVPFG